MKASVLLRAFLCASAVVWATEAAAVNLVVNGGFESGGFGGWSATAPPGTYLLVASGVALKGIKSVSFGGPGSSSISQDLATIPGWYLVSIFLALDSDPILGGPLNSFSGNFGPLTFPFIGLNNLPTNSPDFPYRSFFALMEAGPGPTKLTFRGNAVQHLPDLPEEAIGFSSYGPFWSLDDVSVWGESVATLHISPLDNLALFSVIRTRELLSLLDLERFRDTAFSLDMPAIDLSGRVYEATLRFDPEPVPEPATLLLLSAGLLSFAPLFRRKFRRKGP